MFFEITVRGAVQGVGFRPYIHALAVKMNIDGCVCNEAGIVKIFIRATEEAAQKFTEAIGAEAPPGARIASIDVATLDAGSVEGTEINSVNPANPAIPASPVAITSVILSDGRSLSAALGGKSDFEGFEIIDSPITREDDSPELPVILPDIGICDSCLEEMLNPDNRRYSYSLISCTSCGPRYSIIKALPYDRERTTMDSFEMCPDCMEEYEGRRRPLNAALRHHAQTISCRFCGPQYVFKTSTEESSPGEALERAIAALSAGEIIGLKGTGGYQLLADPFNDRAVSRLREIKGREKKPFAVMFSKVEDIREYAEVSAEEESALRSPARPIVLLEKRSHGTLTVKDLSPKTAYDSRYVGAFLPSIGIHRLLCDALGPLIVTSANVSGEPIIISDQSFCETFLDKLPGVLIHNREILSPADDSVVYVLKKSRSLQFIRRARGYAPLPVLSRPMGDGSHVLSFGADLKAAFCLSDGKTTVMSQYFGDMENYDTVQNYDRELQRAGRLFGLRPSLAVCDKHPLYISSHKAESYAKIHKIPCLRVQHHHAHAASVMAEMGWKSAIGVVFDGTGYGEDGQLWGGEFLLCEGAGFRRLGHLKYLTLCGGDSVSVDAGLAARCYLEAAGLKGDNHEGREAELVRAALKNKINTIESSSMGRLFDAAAFILDIRQKNTYEGECAIALENAAAEFIHNRELSVDVIEAYKSECYSIDGVNISGKNANKMLEMPVFTDSDGIYMADQVALVERLLCRHNAGNHSRVIQSTLAYEFHLAIIDMVKKICINIRNKTGEEKVALSGGCFVNRLLLSGCISVLESEGFDVAWNRSVPLGDGGLSLGQAYLGDKEK